MSVGPAGLGTLLGNLIKDRDVYSDLFKKGKEYKKTFDEISSTPAYRLYVDAVVKGKKDPITRDYFTEEEFTELKDMLKTRLGIALGYTDADYKEDFKKMYKGEPPEHFLTAKKGDKFATSLTYFPNSKFSDVFGVSTLKVPYKDKYENAEVEIYDKYDFNTDYVVGDTLAETAKKFLKAPAYWTAMNMAEKYAADVLPDEKRAEELGVEPRFVPVSVKVPVSELMNEDQWNSLVSNRIFIDPNTMSDDLSGDTIVVNKNLIEERSPEEQKDYKSFAIALLNPEFSGVEATKQKYYDTYGSDVYFEDQKSILGGTNFKDNFVPKEKVVKQKMKAGGEVINYGDYGRSYK